MSERSKQTKSKITALWSTLNTLMNDLNRVRDWTMLDNNICILWLFGQLSQTYRLIFKVVLCGAMSWTRWFSWVLAISYSMILWLAFPNYWLLQLYPQWSSPSTSLEVQFKDIQQGTTETSIRDIQLFYKVCF